MSSVGKQGRKSACVDGVKAQSQGRYAMFRDLQKNPKAQKSP